MTPTQCVNEFIAAIERRDVDHAISFLHDEISYENMPMSPIVGRQAVADVLNGFLGPAREVQWVVSRQWAVGDVVINERLDRFWIGSGWLELPVAGFFNVVDDHITVWRDYFDLSSYMNQFNALTND